MPRANLGQMTRREAGKLMLVGGVVSLGTTKHLLAQGYPGHWVAEWIWIARKPSPFHFFLMARRGFNLDTRLSVATMKITAADRYLVYINGQYVGRGPARGDSRWMPFDTYYVGPHLRAGKNVIAVLAYHYGCSNNYTRDARAGLFVQLDMSRDNKSRQVIGSDAHWKVRQARGWRRDVGLVSNKVGVTEVYDANLDPANWAEPGFDDSSWEPPYVIPKDETPWSYLEPRQTPMMEEVEVFPSRVVTAGEVEDVESQGTDVPGRLAAESHFSLQYAKVSNPEAVLKADGQVAQLQCGEAPGGLRSPFLIVDFGQPLFGFPRVSFDAPANTVIEMTYGPELKGGRVLGLMQGVRYGDRYVARPGKNTWQTFEYKQIRYMEIVCREMETPVSVDSISAVSYQYPAERRGSFECSEPLLTKLWKACIDTTYLHMEDTLVCDAVRERRCWTGDGGHGLFGIYAAFGDVAITDWYFRLIARGQLADGMLRMYYPSTDNPPGTDDEGSPCYTVGDHCLLQPASVSDNPVYIPQFALFYAFFVGDHYQYFGKRNLVSDLYPTLVNLARWCERQADETGLLCNLPMWDFVDWVPTEMQGANFETNALYYQMLASLGTIAADLGKPMEASKCKSQAETIRNTLRRLHWNPSRQLYVDSVIEGKQSGTVTETANGMALLFDIATPDQVPRIIQLLADPHSDIVRATPLYFYYTLEGLLKQGAAEVALRQMRERYAPMIEASDVPTIWEKWKLYEPHKGLFWSQVHSGGVGPALTLSTHVLGVCPTEPGFQRCRIEPKAEGLQWARGVFPSVRGDIKVEWRREGERFSLDTVLPAGLETDLTLPRNASKNFVLTHNEQSYAIRAGVTTSPGLVLSGSSVVVKVVGGKHHLEVQAE